MGNKNFLAAGKLGDFIHQLCVCKYVYDQTDQKVNLFITNKGEDFEKPLDFTYNELYPIISKQSWLNKFELYDPEAHSVDVDLTNFRKSPLLYRTNWLRLYFQMFFGISEPPKDFKWIHIDRVDDDYKNTVLINRSTHRSPITNSKHQIYERLINDYDCAFICYDEHQYKAFPFNSKIPMIKVNTLEDFYVKLNSCKHYCGNLSAPSAMATSINKSRLIELHPGDGAHYQTDDSLYSKFKWFA